MKGIIYKWTCLKTGKSYIGQTMHEKKRERDFLNENNIYTKKNSKIDKARKKYGLFEGTWEKEVLKRLWCKEGNENKLIKRLNYWEKYFIKKFNTFNNGYNSTDGGEVTEISNSTKQILKEKALKQHKKNNNHITKEISQLISNKNKGKSHNRKKCAAKTTYKIPVYKIDKQTNKIIEKYESIEKAGKTNNINANSIRCVCRGEKRKTAGGFIWKICDDKNVKKEIKGYYFYKKLNRWKSRIKFNKKDYTLGYFILEESAKEMYNLAKSKINENCFLKWYDNLYEEKIKVMKKCGEI